MTNHTNNTTLTALFTSKATDIHQLISRSIVDGKIINMPSAAEVNEVFLSLPKQNRDKTTYVLVFTIATLNDANKMQPILTKAIASIADKETGVYEADKAVTKCIALVKAFISLGQDLIDVLANDA